MSRARAAIAVLHDEGDPPSAVMSGIGAAASVGEVTVATPAEADTAVEPPDCAVAVTDGDPDPVKAAAEAFPDVPVLAVTSVADGEDATTVLEAGAVDVVRWDDVGRQVLERRVERVLERRRYQRRVETAMAVPRGATLLLSPEGTIERADETARSTADGPVTGRDVRDLPWWEEGATADLDRALQRVREGEAVSFEPGEGADANAEVIVRPVTMSGGTADAVANVRGIADGSHRIDRRSLLRTVVENVPIVLFAFDAEGTFHLSTGKGLEALGLESGEVVGDSVFDVYAEHETVLENCRRALAGERVDTVVEVNDTAFETWYVPLTTDGEVREVIGAALDVTDLHERTRELARQNERLEEFASIVSHDLRNPLNVARGAVEILNEDPAEQNVERLEEALARMDAIVDDVLTLARSGETVEAPEEVSLERVARSAWRAVETKAATLEVPDEADLLAAPGRLQRLLENLFANAVEHGTTNTGGSDRGAITRRSANSAPASADGDVTGEGDLSVTIGTTDDGFYVADDGRGIPEGDHEAVFESGYSTAESGTGFGLSIVREIAQAHGWEASVTESGGDGARFEFRNVEFA